MEKEPMPLNCFICKFFREFDFKKGDSSYGTCRRHAPKVLQTEFSDHEWSIETRWPVVKKTDFCGDSLPEEK